MVGLDTLQQTSIGQVELELAHIQSLSFRQSAQYLSVGDILSVLVLRPQQGHPIAIICGWPLVPGNLSGAKGSQTSAGIVIWLIPDAPPRLGLPVRLIGLPQ